MYIDGEFIQKETIERREYQVRIAQSAAQANTLVVLPTGMGKTIIALLLIARALQKQTDKILFLAPTKPLVTQHALFLKEFLTIDSSEVAMFTGEISPAKRKATWEGSRIIVSTPQVIENDLLSKRLDLHEVSLIVFDEAHHAVGEYAYVFVSEMYQKQREQGLALGITASPGNDVTKILEVCKNLAITNIEIRTKYDPDVRPYVHDLKLSWKEVTLPQEFSYTLQILRKALVERLTFLKNLGMIESASPSLVNRTKLLETQQKVQGAIRSRAKPPKILFKAASVQSEAMKIHYAIELLQTQGVNALKNYFQRMGKEARSKEGSKASRTIMSDSNLLEAVAYVKSLNVEHPKIPELAHIVQQQLSQKKDAKIIVFTHFRDTSAHVVKVLSSIEGARPVRFIGQAAKGDDKGLTQKQQAEIITQFKKGTYNVLIATSVAEEGLDIPSTDLVVFYEPIPSEIRAIQRRGRTARKMPGKVIILITKGTSDEAYYWAAKRKEKRMRSELELIRSQLTKKTENGSFDEKNVSQEIENQKTLGDFQKKDTPVTIAVDHREYRSPVVKNLVMKGASIDPQQLDVGDYVLSSRIGIERKRVDDFLESLIRGKLFKQLARLRDTYARPLLVIEGEGLYTKRNISHNAIVGSFSSAIVDFGIPIITTKDAIETAGFLYIMASREQREDKKIVAVRGEKTTMSLRDRQQFIVEGLPNVSAVLAKRLLDRFGSIKDIVNASEKELCQVNGVGKHIASDILAVLHADYLTE
ncbi:MAG: DEAD/DEAH box helicase family protein [Candidatus Thermoplasmatota archaeon]|nr:DEAD/DEAH box helicase family protein [Candidatus Thermoplasmatota archaeon]